MWSAIIFNCCPPCVLVVNTHDFKVHSTTLPLCHTEIWQFPISILEARSRLTTAGSAILLEVEGPPLGAATPPVRVPSRGVIAVGCNSSRHSLLCMEL